MIGSRIFNLPLCIQTDLQFEINPNALTLHNISPYQEKRKTNGRYNCTLISPSTQCSPSPLWCFKKEKAVATRNCSSCCRCTLKRPATATTIPAHLLNYSRNVQLDCHTCFFFFGLLFLRGLWPSELELRLLLGPVCALCDPQPLDERPLLLVEVVLLDEENPTFSMDGAWRDEDANLDWAWPALLYEFFNGRGGGIRARAHTCFCQTGKEFFGEH